MPTPIIGQAFKHDGANITCIDFRIQQMYNIMDANNGNMGTALSNLSISALVVNGSHISGNFFLILREQSKYNSVLITEGTFDIEDINRNRPVKRNIWSCVDYLFKISKDFIEMNRIEFEIPKNTYTDDCFLPLLEVVNQ